MKPRNVTEPTPSTGSLTSLTPRRLQPGHPDWPGVDLKVLPLLHLAWKHLHPCQQETVPWALCTYPTTCYHNKAHQIRSSAGQQHRGHPSAAMIVFLPVRMAAKIKLCAAALRSPPPRRAGDPNNTQPAPPTLH
ncbi:unnamed protein product [Gadus morhua 'NCC']